MDYFDGLMQKSKSQISKILEEDEGNDQEDVLQYLRERIPVKTLRSWNEED